MNRHRNLPFFVPHAGCPNCCVFCSQTKITGVAAEKDPNLEIAELRAMLESAKAGGDTQIAFFGGSFTAIERTRMEALLKTARAFIEKGVAGSIRISTRPDCINQEILSVLKEYSVTHIELGIQSTNDSVLSASGRGHDSKASFKASELILKNGFVFGGQMMIGLPGSTKEAELQTALDIISMGATEARIYPTVVFEGTKLFEMVNNREYTPLSLDEAVERSACCYRAFNEKGVKLLRIGLHSTENLKNAPLGANHPSIGELVKGRVYADIICELAGACGGKKLKIHIKESDISMLCGHGGEAIKYIKEKTNAAELQLIKGNLPQFEPKVEII